MVDDPIPLDARSRCEVCGESVTVERNDLIRTGRMVDEVSDSWTSRKSLVSYRSDTARYLPSCEMLDEIRLVRN